MKQIRKIIPLVVLLLGGLMMISCSDKNGVSMKNNYNTYAFIYKNEGNLYGDREMEGFKNAIEETGGKYILCAPESPSAEDQIQMIKELTKKRVDAIAVAANDVDALQPALEESMKKGIKVLSTDSAVNKDSRLVHVNQTDSQLLGSYLIRSAYDMCGGKGEIGIVSATRYAENQNTWIMWMEEELKKPEYENMKLVDIVYGDDEREQSIKVTKRLIEQYPSIKVIIAPTVVGVKAAAEVVESLSMEGQIKVTGLGLPTQMEPHIKAGTCPLIYLWNPIDIGYLTGYTAVALVENKITGAVGDVFEANRLGRFKIVSAMDGGTEIILGAPFKFDIDNIDEWKDVY